MNKRLPYEEEMAAQLKDVSLPDEDMAWADMRRRLEEDDDDRGIPFWLNGCFLWIVFGLFMLSLGLWIIRPEKWFEKKKVELSKTTSGSREGEQKNSSQETELQHDSTDFFERGLEQPQRTYQNEDGGGINIEENSRTFAENNTKNPKEKKDRSEQMKDGRSLFNSKIPAAKENRDDGVDSDGLHNQNLITDRTVCLDKQNDTTVKATTTQVK